MSGAPARAAAHPDARRHVAEDELDRSLRPRRLEDFVGQERAARTSSRVAIEAASARGEALDHVLLAGPPGLGKTSLAQIVAAELDVPFVQTAGPALERKADIAAFLTALEPRSVFFVDEIHRLPRALEETFYPAMEDRRLPITVGQGAGARVVTLDLPPFTLIGATTRAGPADDAAARPLRHPARGSSTTTPTTSRRSCAARRRSSTSRSSDDGAHAIAARSRGTPRVANRLLKRVRDFAEVRGGGVIDAAIAARGARPARGRRRAASTASTARSCARSARTSAAARSGSRRWPSPSARSRTRSRTSTSPTCSSEGLIKRTPRGRAATAARLRAPRPRAARAPSGAVLSTRRDASRNAVRSGRHRRARICLRSTMAHLFICPNCGNRTHRDRAHRRLPPRSPRAARSAASRSCSSCSTTTTRRPTPRSSSATRRAGHRLRPRLLRAHRACEEESVIGRPVERRARPALRQTATTASDTVLEWGVRELGQAGAGQRRGRPPGRAPPPTCSRLRRRRRAAARADPEQVGCSRAWVAQ